MLGAIPNGAEVAGWLAYWYDFVLHDVAKTKQLPHTVYFFYTDNVDDLEITHIYGNGMNIIGIVVMSVVFGIAMSTMTKSVPALIALVNEVSLVMMRITSWVIFISPVGIFFLTLSQMIYMDNLDVIIGKLGLYLLTVIGGILFHGFIVLPVIFYAFTRKNPYIFVARMGQALATAFGTASRLADINALMDGLVDGQAKGKRALVLHVFVSF